jgi:uncharacterized protein involved in outer membrane biogenesis
MIEQFLDYVMPTILMIIIAVIVAAVAAHLAVYGFSCPKRKR